MQFRPKNAERICLRLLAYHLLANKPCRRWEGKEKNDSLIDSSVVSEFGGSRSGADLKKKNMLSKISEGFYKISLFSISYSWLLCRGFDLFSYITYFSYSVVARH